MRYRKLDADGDYVMGPGTQWLVDNADAVAQAVITRMRLYAGEWFLDKREGLDRSQFLGYGTQSTRDFEMQRRILGTQGVVRIIAYSSSVDSSVRSYRVSCTLETIYGVVAINEVIR